jgi:hypothetical protein
MRARKTSMLNENKRPTALGATSSTARSPDRGAAGGLMGDPPSRKEGVAVQARVRSGLADSVERSWSIDVDPLSSTEGVHPYHSGPRALPGFATGCGSANLRCFTAARVRRPCSGRRR